MKLVNFDDLPLGARFIYPNDETNKVLVVLSKHRKHSDTEPMSGTVAEWVIEAGARGRQNLYSHIAGDDDCPQEVWMLDEEIILREPGQ